MNIITSEKFFRFRPLIIMVGLILFTSTFCNALSEKSVVRVNADYKIKRSANGDVILYSQKQDQAKEEFVFTEFNADVILLIYRKLDTNYIINSLSQKYHMSKTEARRQVKMTIYELENCDLVVSE